MRGDTRPAVFLTPAASFLAAVVLFPAVYILWLSLERRLLVFNVVEFVGFENYWRLLADTRFWNALWNTVYFTAVSVTLELGLGLSVALLLRRAFRGRALMYAVVLVPWAIPTVVSARMWEWMYNAEFGVLNYVLGTSVNWLGHPAWAMHAAIVMDVWKSTPFVILLLLAGLQNIPRELYLAARLDGASAWTQFRAVTLPLLAPLIWVVSIFRTIDAFRVFDTIYVLTGGGPANSTETLSIYAYKILFQQLEFGYGSTVAVVAMLCVGAAALLYARLMRQSLA
jgi:multiple sugar transport system permease protein